MVSTSKIALHSFNTRGLSNKNKRQMVFAWLQNNFKGVIFLQETHTTEISEATWRHEWSGDVYFSHGTSNSRGVAILIPKGINILIHNVTRDNSGRYIILDATIDDNQMTLINIYAPTRDNINDQLQFIQELQTSLIEYIDKNLIIGGDFNTYLNPKLDKKGYPKDSQSTYTTSLTELMEVYNLVDIWRVLNPDLKRYTWRGMTRSGQAHSRIDYFMISTNMIYDFNKAIISPSIKSDHSIISISFNLTNSIKHGKGFWKFNNSLLTDKHYVDKINDVIENTQLEYEYVEDKSLLWDLIKCKIRGETISYSSFKAKENRNKENKLIETLKAIESEIDKRNHIDQEIQAEYNNIKQQIEDINEKRAKGNLIRSKANWIENNEKSSKYFLQLKNKNHKSKYIKSLIVNNKTITDCNQWLAYLSVCITIK